MTYDSTDPSVEMARRVAEQLTNIFEHSPDEAAQLVKSYVAALFAILMAGADSEGDFYEGIALFIADLVLTAKEMVKANPDHEWGEPDVQ